MAQPLIKAGANVAAADCAELDFLHCCLRAIRLRNPPMDAQQGFMPLPMPMHSALDGVADVLAAASRKEDREGV